MKKIKRKHKQIFSIITLLISFFCLISCGIPTIASFDDFLTIGSINSSTNEFSITLTNPNNYTISNNTPALLLMYSISDSNTSPINDSSFNSTYGQASSGRPVNFNTDYENENSDLKVKGGIINRTLGSDNASTGKYHTALFPLVPEGSTYESINANNSYTYNLYEFLGNSGTVTLKLELKSDNFFYLTVKDKQIKLGRFVGSKFLTYSEVTSHLNTEDSTSPYGDYWYFKKANNSGGSGIEIHIYLALNIIGEDFSNLYWSDLKEIDTFKIK